MYTFSMSPPMDQPPKSIIGQWSMPDLKLRKTVPHPKQPLCHGAFFVPQLLSKYDCQRLTQLLPTREKQVPVGFQGYQDSGAIGSFRSNAWSPSFAQELWKLCALYFQNTPPMKDHTPTDWFAMGSRKAHRVWEAIGVSPLMRFMCYPNGGQHLPHYDMGYDYGDGRRTLMSVVLYLNDILPSEGGQTRFIDDRQAHIHASERNYKDWKRPASTAEIISSVQPSCGGALFFYHRLCHDVSPYTAAHYRYILRTDIIFRAHDHSV